MRSAKQSAPVKQGASLHLAMLARVVARVFRSRGMVSGCRRLDNVPTPSPHGNSTSLTLSARRAPHNTSPLCRLRRWAVWILRKVGTPLQVNVIPETESHTLTKAR
jgi:hypothetical protein